MDDRTAEPHAPGLLSDPRLELRPELRPELRAGRPLGAIRRLPCTPCPVQAVLSRIGDKWSALAIFNLGDCENMRFSELRRAIPGISKRMLSATLQNLEYDGLVRRTVLGTHPPEVRYALTDLGRSLRLPVKGLADWAVSNATAMEAARRRYEEEAAQRTRTPWQP